MPLERLRRRTRQRGPPSGPASVQGVLTATSLFGRLPDSAVWQLYVPWAPTRVVVSRTVRTGQEWVASSGQVPATKGVASQ